MRTPMLTRSGVGMRRLRAAFSQGGVIESTAPATTFLYDEGTEQVAWVEGASFGEGSATKNADHLFLEATKGITATGTSRRTWVTDAAVDLTGVSSVAADWEFDFTGSGTHEGWFVVSTNKTSNETVRDAGMSLTNDRARQEDSIDVSGLTGLHFVRFHCHINDPSALAGLSARVRVYKVSYI